VEEVEIEEEEVEEVETEEEEVEVEVEVEEVEEVTPIYPKMISPLKKELFQDLKEPRKLCE